MGADYGLADCCTICRECERPYCRDNNEHCPDCYERGCGRLDLHDEHEWTRPRSPFWPDLTYLCTGDVVIEGGAL